MTMVFAHSNSILVFIVSMEQPFQRAKPKAARKEQREIGPHKKRGVDGYLSSRNPPSSGPREKPIVLHKP